MAKPKTWSVTIDGEEHHVIYVPDFWTARPRIYVDNQPVAFQNPSFFSKFGMGDYEIPIGEKTGHVVALGRSVRLAINGFYLDHHQLYQPLSDKLPWWQWFFLILHLLAIVPVSFLCGTLPGFMVAMSAFFCLQVSLRPIHGIIKFLLFFLITVFFSAFITGYMILFVID